MYVGWRSLKPLKGAGHGKKNKHLSMRNVKIPQFGKGLFCVFGLISWKLVEHPALVCVSNTVLDYGLSVQLFYFFFV